MMMCGLTSVMKEKEIRRGVLTMPRFCVDN